MTFRCLLSLPQVDRVRWHLFPGIRVSQATFDLGSPSAPKVETVPDIVRMMALQQEQLARSMGEGHRVIHGVAGSGKTMILGYRAQYLAQALAAEAKLLYVAMTRAMERLHMTHHASSAFVDGLRAALGAGTAARSGSTPA